MVQEKKIDQWNRTRSTGMMNYTLTLDLLQKWNFKTVRKARMHAKLLQLCLTLQPHRLQPLQGPLSMKFFRQEYWSGLTFSPPGDLLTGKDGLLINSTGSLDIHILKKGKTIHKTQHQVNYHPKCGKWNNTTSRIFLWGIPTLSQIKSS